MTTIFLADFLNFLKNPKSYLVSTQDSIQTQILNQERTLNNNLEEFSETKKDLIVQTFNSPELSFKQKAWLFIKTLCFSLVVAIILGSLGSVISSLLKYSQSENNRLFEFYGGFSVISVIFIISIVGPFLEELSYRLFLTTKKTWFLLGLFFFFSFNLQILVEVIKDKNLAILVFLIGVFFMFLATLLATFLISKDNIKFWVSNYFNQFFYIVSIVFGLAHISNYQNLRQIIFLMPILVLPQLFVTFVFGYVRIRFNSFWWAFAMHSFYNFFTSIALLIYSVALDKPKLNELIKVLDQEDSNSLKDIIKNSDTFFQIRFFGLNILLFSLYIAIFCIFLFVIYEYFRFFSSKVKPKEIA
jgi:membrane protease YdiL (CAAX protease family)